MRNSFVSLVFAGTLGVALCAMVGIALAGPVRGERLQAELQERFARADRDGDGRLSETEAEAGMPFVARHFAAIDSEGQGSVGLEQVKAFAREQVARRKAGQ
ncbi:hypothetical protein AvCA_46530 [Azotobacter vinelandii CA]|uniref:EF-hand domain-containing protein n=2 Tax=Azotobacter vinelandii TaxID=354 RepID=C1DIT9_AZOVD|nr:EF-hand domain-containing protein [Azotobacter vinelandii]ACO80758.1 hypothetical protein Avin_46530 [Azotobacter vinelandii DJ]AGK15891.1 hypothetical protein AvCA_46530 [Azotobacter vinelandii CA]AGK22136.1 hypothetical protein AvCA6_46530 [Azotobacter vinelandii CA6]SFX04195.1 hypothetical protein SAMN04244547_00263 [Azotobacter vinelandii]GLK60763.1 hypothetical protein GCM10017624_29250 [Azotobacter vinelandii]